MFLCFVLKKQFLKQFKQIKQPYKLYMCKLQSLDASNFVYRKLISI